MPENNSSGFFDKLNPKTSFFVGLASGLIIVFVVGFFVLLSMVLSGDGIGKLAWQKEAATPQAGVNQPTTNQPSEQVAVDTDFEITENDHILGNFDAPITIVEFSDFQCPYCSRFHPSLEQALADYPDQVRWVYKHFPLTSIHPEAVPAAIASECAAGQGGDETFWAYADALFENQSTLGRATYVRLAEELNLDTSDFEDCLDSGSMQAKVQADYQEGIAAGVRGTPGSFINGISIPGAVPYDQVKAVIDSLL